MMGLPKNLALVGMLAGVLGGVVPRTPGATFTVTTLADDGPGSLRAAISNSSAGDAVYFVTNGVIVLTNGELVVSHDLDIYGPGPTNLAVSGNFSSRVFNVSNEAVVNISGLAIRDGHASDGASDANRFGGDGAHGGAICSDGDLSLSNCTITASSAGNGGLGLDGGGGGSGGAIFNLGILNLTRCALKGNSAGQGGPASNRNGGSGGSGGGVFNFGVLVVNDCTFADNTAGAGGTAQADAGVGGSGGAILNSSGLMTLVGCTFNNNRAGNGGVGTSNSADGGSGAGIWNSGAVTMTNCTLSSNAAGDGGRGYKSLHRAAGGNGAGIWNSVAITLTSCTLNRNSAGRAGARIFDQPADGSGGGIYSSAGSSLTLRNTLVADNTVATNWVAPDIFGAVHTQGHNLISRVDANTSFDVLGCCDVIGTLGSPVAPLLAPLADNGGPAPTEALLSGSPALDAGDDSLSGSAATDQRGYPRQAGSHVDIGALEYQLPSLPLRIASFSQLQNRSVQLTFTNYPGATFTVLAATNVSLPLAVWATVGQATPLSPGQFHFTNPQATNSPRRFYQIRSP